MCSVARLVASDPHLVCRDEEKRHGIWVLSSEQGRGNAVPKRGRKSKANRGEHLGDVQCRYTTVSDKHTAIDELYYLVTRFGSMG